MYRLRRLTGPRPSPALLAATVAALLALPIVVAWLGRRLSARRLAALDDDEVSWLPPAPWTASHNVLRDAEGDYVGEISPRSAQAGEHVDAAGTIASLAAYDHRLAELIARLVNEHVDREDIP